MIIKSMFKDDIDRPINGVIQVEQEEESVVEQEIKEYVVTTELKKHFNNFFESYADSFDHPTDNIGVWITGFFGSGKSHFLKMLSYILENRIIDGKKTTEYFREKFDDELSFMPIEKATSVPTETILFNIDVEGPMEKDATAVLKVFAKVFYKHMGFYGNDLKLAKLEQFIAKKGKLDEFLDAFESINGESWYDTRDSYAFFEDDIIECMVNVLGMSREAAQHWFDGTEGADISIGQLVDEIKDYVSTKPKDFRLLFMIDEAGQYIGTDTNLLLNLQSLIEKLGSTCRGQVWVVATGQEALDDMIKVRTDEFSRIMARFKVRLSLTSSSVGEVIEKRLLSKKDNAADNLEMVYDNNDAVLRNLFAFDTNRKDIRGFKSGDEFVRQFPFVPYQFLVMQNIYNEIRKHGHTGKHQSQGERSMLNGFQESAQAVEYKDEFSIVPLYAFYDTLHSSLDTAIRSVVERAERAEKEGLGLEHNDVNLLKLLYLIRYVDDIPSNIENLTILMANDIRTDKLQLREEITKSLDRLITQYYVSRNGDQYMFLTDEEQDIERDIRNTEVDSSSVVSSVGSLIFDDIYSNKKYRYNNKYDFEFKACVDNQNIGSSKTGMTLKFVTAAADPYDTTEFKLLMDSQQDMAICVLSDEYPYYENLEIAAKIRKYVKQRNINQLAPSVQRIIQDKQNEAGRLEKQAKEDIQRSILAGKYYVHGEILSLSGTDVTAKINNAMKHLVESTYTKLGYIDEGYDTDADIIAVLKGKKVSLEGVESNKLACDDVLDYLDIRKMQNIKVSMFDIQSRYGSIPYGWREQDIAGVVAELIFRQKVVIKVSGQIISPTDYKMVGYLRKKSEIGNARISRRESPNVRKMQEVRKFLREYFNVMDVPADEDGLFTYIIQGFKDKKIEIDHYKDLNATRHYPGYDKVLIAGDLIDQVIKCENDGVALIDTVFDLIDDLLDSKDNIADVTNFFKTQKTLFDNATAFNNEISGSLDYFADNKDVIDALKRIKQIVTYKENYNYSQIKDLNGLISTVNTAKAELVEILKTEILDIIDQCSTLIEERIATNPEKLSGILPHAKERFDGRRNEVDTLNDLLLLDSKKTQIWKDKDYFDKQIDKALKPVVVVTPPKKKVKKGYKNAIFKSQKLHTKEDIDNYVEALRKSLMDMLSDCDEIDIQ